MTEVLTEEQRVGHSLGELRMLEDVARKMGHDPRVVFILLATSDPEALIIYQAEHRNISRNRADIKPDTRYLRADDEWKYYCRSRVARLPPFIADLCINIMTGQVSDFKPFLKRIHKIPPEIEE